MTKSQRAVEQQMNAAVNRLNELDRDIHLELTDREMLNGIQAIARGLYVIASHMDEDRDDNRRFQNRTFAVLSSILVSVVASMIVLVVTNI